MYQLAGEGLALMCTVCSWVDAGTRAVVLEMSIYSASVNRFAYIQLMFEIPAEGPNIVPLNTVFTFQVDDGTVGNTDCAYVVLR